MKKNILFLLGVLFLIITFFVSNGYSNVGRIDFFIDDFSEDIVKNHAGGKSYSFFSGEVKSRAPWILTKIASDKSRKKVLKIDYDIEGSLAEYRMPVAFKRIMKKYKGLGFFIKSDIGNIKVKFIGDEEHEYLCKVEKGKWNKIEIPYSDFSKSNLLNLASVNEIRFVFDSKVAESLDGVILLDDVVLLKHLRKKKKTSKHLPPSIIAKVNGKNIAADGYESEVIELDLKYQGAIDSDDFRGVRFEASIDGKNWFFIGEDLLKDNAWFSSKWDVTNFESSSYFLRGVSIFDGELVEGRAIKIKVKTSLDMDNVLNTLQRRAFNYFLDNVDIKTGVVKVTSDKESSSSALSAASSLFAYCVGLKNEFAERDYLAEKTLLVLKKYSQDDFKVFGFFSNKAGKGNIFSTTYFLIGAMLVKECFSSVSNPKEKEIRRLAKKIISDVKWKKALSNKKGRMLLCENLYANDKREGFIEGPKGLLPYLLAISDSNGISDESWQDCVKAFSYIKYKNNNVLSDLSLLFFELPHLFLNIENKKDSAINYFSDAISQVLINYEFSKRYNNYPADVWGVSYCLARDGYKNYGVNLVQNHFSNDGTISSTAVIGALNLMPVLSKAGLVAFHNNYGKIIWGKYGFHESFNPGNNWFYERYTALSTAITLVAIENYKSGFIQKTFSQNSLTKRALSKMGFLQDR